MTIISHIFHSLIHILTIYKWASFNFAHLYYMKSILNRAGGSLYIGF